MRRKPDVKYTKTNNDIMKLSNIQKQLLEAAAPLLKQGGQLVYSTCTVDKEENDRVAATFLEQHPEFESDTTLSERMPESVQPFVEGHTLQVFPQYFSSDGFFIASFRKKVL